MKFIRKLFVTAVVLAMLLCSFTVAVSAATASISVSSKSPAVGSNITVSINFSGGSIYATEGELSYNSAVLQYLSGSDTNGASGRIKLSNYSGRTSYSISFKVIGVGASNLVLSNCFIADFDEQRQDIPSVSTSINAVASGGGTTNINGDDYTVNLSPEKYTVAGFTLQSAEYGGKEIPIFKSESGVRLAVLTASDGSEGLYLLSDDNISFVRAESVKLSGKDYLYIGVLENSDTDTEKMSKQNKTVAGAEREVYLPDSAAQNSAVVCFYAINEKGELNLYYYDIEGDFLFPYSDITAGKTIVKTVNKTADKSEKLNDMLFKISLIVSAALFVTVIILLVLLISSNKKKRKERYDFTPPYIDQDELKF